MKYKAHIYLRNLPRNEPLILICEGEEGFGYFGDTVYAKDCETGELITAPRDNVAYTRAVPLEEKEESDDNGN